MKTIIDKLKNWKTPIKWAAFVKGYLVILGLVTFPLFIAEESVQVAQGGTWAAKAAKDWETMKAGCELVDDTATLLERSNLIAGWLNPFGFAAYNHYARNSHYYAKACRKQAEAGEAGRRKDRDND